MLLEKYKLATWKLNEHVHESPEMLVRKCDREKKPEQVSRQAVYNQALEETETYLAESGASIRVTCKAFS